MILLVATGKTWSDDFRRTMIFIILLLFYGTVSPLIYVTLLITSLLHLY